MITSPERRYLGFGGFLPPLHDPGQNPTLALQRDLELVEAMDRLGFDECWFGEHHSFGAEIFGCPELMIAAAAERTKRIKLGTGVTSLQFHHPFLVAERMVMLDHLTRGRAMFGAGPGSLPSDSHMFGLDYAEARPKMAESLRAILHLLRSDEPLTMRTSWFALQDARLNLRPYSRHGLETAAASAVSPAGARLAGEHGIGLLSLATQSAAGFAALRSTWQIVQEQADIHGQAVDRADWRIAGFFHIADTEEQARRDVRQGLPQYCRYMKASTVHLPLESDFDDVDALATEINESGFGCIGSVDRMRAMIDRYWEQTEGFGTLLFIGHDWADREATLRSHELTARYLMPAFQGSAARPTEQFTWCNETGGWQQHTLAAWDLAKQTYAADMSAR